MSHYDESSSLVTPSSPGGGDHPRRPASGDRVDVDHQGLTTFLELAAQEMKLPFDRGAARRRFGELDNDRRSGWGVTELNAIVVAASAGVSDAGRFNAVDLG